jgi:hypothetical protein
VGKRGAWHSTKKSFQGLHAARNRRVLLAGATITHKIAAALVG